MPLGMTAHGRRAWLRAGMRATTGVPARIRSLTWLARLGGRIVLLVVVASCNSKAELPGDAPDGDWSSPEDSAITHRIQDDAGLCSQCIHLQRLVVLGDSTEPGDLDVQTTAAIRDKQGRYWLGQDGLIKVFAADGNFVRQVGRSGQGPMEFQLPRPVHADSTGRVHIIDPGNSRASVIGSDFSLVTERRLPSGDPHSFVPIDDGDSYALNMWLSDAATVGNMVHIVRGDTVLRSFGGPRETEILNPFTSQRILTADGAGRIFAIPRFEMEVVAWSKEGRRIADFLGPNLNEKEVQWKPYNRDDNPIPNEVVAMQVDRQQRLWVITRRVREDWRTMVRDRVYPNGMIGLDPKPGVTLDSINTSRIEIIDLRRRVIVARVDRSELWSAFIGDGLLLQNFSDADGIPKVAVWRAELRAGRK